jgi:hypothetical protein
MKHFIFSGGFTNPGRNFTDRPGCGDLYKALAVRRLLLRQPESASWPLSARVSSRFPGVKKQQRSLRPSWLTNWLTKDATPAGREFCRLPERSFRPEKEALLAVVLRDADKMHERLEAEAAGERHG